MSRYLFKEGEEVAHRDNLTHKMYIRRILWEEKNIFQGKYDDTKKPLKELKRFLIGIECYWFGRNDNGDKEMQIEKFHSRVLVPWNVALQGTDEVIRWIEQ